MVKPKRKKKFKRQESTYKKKLETGWRKPRGMDSKMRIRKKGKLPIVLVGYRNPKSTRDIHPSGLVEVLVSNVKDLESIDPKKQAVRIRSTVGKRKREEILKVAKSSEIKVLNLGIRVNKEEKKEEPSKKPEAEKEGGVKNEADNSEKASS